MAKNFDSRNTQSTKIGVALAIAVLAIAVGIIVTTVNQHYTHQQEQRHEIRGTNISVPMHSLDSMYSYLGKRANQILADDQKNHIPYSVTKAKEHAMMTAFGVEEKKVAASNYSRSFDTSAIDRAVNSVPKN